MSLRLRLVVFIVATIAAIQAFTAALVYDVARDTSLATGRQQLSQAAEAFMLQLEDASARVADTVHVLSLDFALRTAIAQRDRDTVLSALRNHGRRVGAARMMLLDVDGGVVADTGDAPLPADAALSPELIDRAMERPASTVSAWDGRAYWTVVVPVFAPALTGLIAASIPIDDALLARMQRQSALPQAIELAARDGDGRWQVVAGGQRRAGLVAHAQDWIAADAPEPHLVDLDGNEYLALAAMLGDATAPRPVAVLMGYSVDDALAPYRAVAPAWASLLVLGVLVGLAGALLFARGVSRPLDRLVARARGIAAGDYTVPPARREPREVAELAAAFTGMGQAIAEREEHIRHQADHDATTSLPNRASFEAEVARHLAHDAAGGGALLMIALARLPEIVKTMGHGLGDRVMREAARRLATPAASASLARVTDGAFALWLPGGDRDAAIALAFRVLDALGAPHVEADLAVDLAPAAGIALAPFHGREASTLLQRAEVALIATLGSDDPVAVYDPATDPHRPDRLSLMADLREAIDHDHLHLQFQPKLGLAHGTIGDVECLVRWRHPRLGALAPDAFIALAEETGNMRRLTRWVLAAAIAQARAWMLRGLDLRVAVNLSARDLDDADLPRRVGELLTVHALAPSRLVLEVTESAVMRHPDAALPVLQRLAGMGIELAIDDFGVGQASFAYLRRLPVRELKIDKVFVLTLATREDDQAIVDAIVALGHRLGHRVTAEGVEDAATLAHLARIGCDHAQGFHIARPLDAADLERFLASRAAEGDAR
ncbi:putative bifunctional diguanylate cyclase/phosphodiesterase [Dokdonella sp. MW10]|uniref:putative bifunctional diguanylate cyclase/phosphodiesterase n=1 Tax=Dokdonella sp. MW10 TaxID=2992926 RepID=UPI003F7D18E6